MEYELVYEYQPWLSSWLLTMLLLGIAGWSMVTWLAWNRLREAGRLTAFQQGVLAVIGVSFGLLGSGGVGVACRAQTSEGRAPVETIEGTVAVLSAQPVEGHAPGDLIEVAGRQFEVNFYRATPGYSRTIAHGGVLREGASVRLQVQGDNIVRIEVRRPNGDER